jgi:hypothetical protein
MFIQNSNNRSEDTFKHFITSIILIYHYFIASLMPILRNNAAASFENKAVLKHKDTKPLQRSPSRNLSLKVYDIQKNKSLL